MQSLLMPLPFAPNVCMTVEHANERHKITKLHRSFFPDARTIIDGQHMAHAWSWLSARAQVLLNYYRDGNDTVAWHSDNEKLYGDQPTIASLSFGSSRDFVMRSIKNNNEKIK